MAAKKEATPLELDDFGFTFATEDELQPAHIADQLAASTATAEEWQERFYQLKEMVMVLLNNLKKNPEKEYILWPDRGAKIDAFVKKIDSLDDKA